ncbi:MAG: biotin/lipoyl-containing protein [Planctomycetota bacterium]|jgi:pyruvate dehydrogenase E2 component (dihydrolipoamide acetyltransferase)
MADFEVKLPSLQETSGDDSAGDEAKVSFVYVDEGDTVNEGDDLIEMETDKATFNVPSPKSGTVKSLSVEETDVLKNGDLICILDV